MTVVPVPIATSVMAIAAHPDDIESGCAGTLAQAVDTGAVVRLLLVTCGDAGSDDPTVTRAAVGSLREAEAVAAAQILGIHEVAFLHVPDGDVENTRALRRDLVLWLRRWRPDVLFTHDPDHPVPPYLTHRDHREVGRAALDAVYPLARDRLSFADDPDVVALPPHHVAQVWLFASATATMSVDISAGLERKIAARLAHTSQTRDPEQLRQSWRARAATCGVPDQIAVAETFTILTLAS